MNVIGAIPHRYVWVDSQFTHLVPCGFIRAVWFGLVSIPSRMWGCNVVLESGAIYRNLPLHALADMAEKLAAVKTKYPKS